MPPLCKTEKSKEKLATRRSTGRTLATGGDALTRAAYGTRQPAESHLRPFLTPREERRVTLAIRDAHTNARDE